jgi:hypothetical protein
MITGAEYNREIKIWCTVEWTCLQTLRYDDDDDDMILMVVVIMQ